MLLHVSRYVAVFLQGIVSIAVLYYLPVYFQACLEHGPVKSGVTLFGNVFTVSFGSISTPVINSFPHLLPYLRMIPR